MPDEKDRPSWESERAKLVVAGPPPTTDGTTWDKPAPTEPPNAKVREIPKHLTKIVAFMTGIVADEALLLDLAFEKAMDIVKRNVESKIVGVDHWTGDNAGGGPFTPAHYAAVAAPLAVELYKQALLSVKDQEKEYNRLFEEMLREREAASPGGPRIVIPT